MGKRITIHYTPHGGQQEFHNSAARFRILACGRRFGKTVAGANEAIRQAAIRGVNNEGFIVGPTFWHTEQAWATVNHYLPSEIVKQVWRSPGERRIELVNGAKIWFKSADNPDSLRSKGLDWAWVDEAALVSEEGWNYLRPALMDRKGIAWFTSTPAGHNLFFKLWQRGQDPEQADYKSWSFPTSANPYIDASEIAEFKRDMPQNVFTQEIQAAFIENLGTVFRNVTGHVQKEIRLYEVGETVYVGCDLGKFEDYTVLLALAGDGRVVGFDRFGQLDWPFQQKRIKLFLSQYNQPPMLIDSTGVGDPVYDQLREDTPRISGYKFTNQTKKELIENLSIMLDNGEIVLSDNPVLLSEMQLYSYELGSSGLTKYGAPSGYHDDSVVALALAAWQLKREPKGEIDISFERVSK